MRLEKLISAVGNLPAEEGFGAVLGAALNGLLALALIFGVLLVMDRARKRKEAEQPPEEPGGTPAQKEKDETEETEDQE